MGIFLCWNWTKIIGIPGYRTGFIIKEKTRKLGNYERKKRIFAHMATGGSGQIIDIFGYLIFIREKTRKLRKIQGGKNGSCSFFDGRILVAVLSGSVNIWVEDKRNFGESNS